MRGALLGAVGWLARRVRDHTLSEQELAARAWVLAGNDKTLRLDYDLEPTSLVLDLGGFEGQWASDIHAKYRCTVHVFEPVERFATQIEKRFSRNPAVVVHPFGLASASATARLSVDSDRSSLFVSGRPNSSLDDVKLVEAKSWLEQMGMPEIALMKVNIEGGEYDLLEHLLDVGLIVHFRDLQIQFHDFVPEAETRLRRIQDRLAATHAPTYQVRFVWENWRRREDPGVR